MTGQIGNPNNVSDNSRLRHGVTWHSFGEVGTAEALLDTI